MKETQNITEQKTQPGNLQVICELEEGGTWKVTFPKGSEGSYIFPTQFHDLQRAVKLGYRRYRQELVLASKKKD